VPTASGSSTFNSDQRRPSGRRASRGWQILGCVITLTVGLGSVFAARQTLNAETRRDSAHVAYGHLAARLVAWERPPANGALRGVVFGDSVFAPHHPKSAFAPVLAAALAAGGHPVDLLDLTHVGMSPFQFYYTLDRALAGGPRFAVIEVNLRTFAADWTAIPGLRFPQMTAWLAPRRAWRMRRPLASQQVTMLGMFVTQLQERTDTLMLFDGLRQVSQETLASLGQRINDALGLDTRSDREKTSSEIRLSTALHPEHAQAWYGTDLAGNPTAEILCALADDLRAAHVLPIFVVAPINLQRVESYGVSIAGLDQRLERLRLAVGARQDEWIVTNRLFRSGDFIDGIHVQPASVRRLATEVAERVSPLLAGLEAKPVAGDGSGAPPSD
jgi:hypothetical protein